MTAAEEKERLVAAEVVEVLFGGVVVAAREEAERLAGLDRLRRAAQDGDAVAVRRQHVRAVVVAALLKLAFVLLAVDCRV